SALSVGKAPPPHRTTAAVAATAGRPVPAAEWLMETVGVLLHAPRGVDALRALVLHLAAGLQCDRVALGLRRQTRADLEVMAVSDLPRLSDAAELVRDLHAAMQEASASACTLTHPARRQGTMQAGLAHVQLSRAMGACAVCTVPLGHDGVVLGALTLQRDLGAPFRTEEILRLEQAATYLTPLLRLYLTRAVRRGPSALGQWPVWLEPLRRHLWPVVLGGLLVAGLVPVQREVVAPTRVQGLHERQLVAPRDGFISVVYARPGAQIQSGQSLIDFDGEQASNELRAAEAALTQSESAVSEALARHDQAQIVVQMAKVDEARARADLARRDLERGRVLAPLTGVVVSGDLSRSVGAPVKRGEVLMTVAPTEGFRLVLWVDERDIAGVQAGTMGALRVAARPGQALPMTVTRVTPVARLREGRNGFEVEGALVSGAGALRPGFEGVIRLDTGRQPLAGAVFGRLIDWLRMGWWTLLG
ncbi:MAG: HlyD family efflux transporter periplasmic adaptor subunit, partial [Sphaerotilus sp.]|nr:HlyD family efflux transporter periplasmic adaptor subunit [Sphaerotilus sp.]